jgi:membrane protein DedA with SNARE-associated domain
MTETLQFVVQYGYALLFVWVLFEQGGLPIPATPLILAAGALAGQHKMSLPLVVLTGTAACMGADIFWYHFGQRRGAVVLNLLCRISMEPDSCVRRTETRFERWGARTLLICKFIPGLNTAAPALAGMVNVDYPRFLLFDLLGGLLWSLAYALLGFVFSKQLDRILSDAHLLGNGLLALFLAGVIGYVLYRWRERQRFIEQVKGDRITPDELKHQLEAGEQVVIIDLRHPLDVLTDPRTLPGALQISPEELEARNKEITRDGEVVLFCT